MSLFLVLVPVAVSVSVFVDIMTPLIILRMFVLNRIILVIMLVIITGCFQIHDGPALEYRPIKAPIVKSPYRNELLNNPCNKSKIS